MSPLVSDRVIEQASHTLPPQIRNHREKIAKKLITAALSGLLEATNTLRLLADLLRVVQEREGWLTVRYWNKTGWRIELTDLTVFSKGEGSDLDTALTQVLEPFNKETDD